MAGFTENSIAMPMNAPGSTLRNAAGRLATPVLLWVLCLQPGMALAVSSGGKLDARSEYTNNLWHESQQRLDQFDDLQDPGQRFYRMPSPWDLVTRLQATGSFLWKYSGKRRLSLDIEGAYFFHVKNSIANYGRFNSGLSYSPGKRDLIYLVLDFIPDRFKKNYRVEAGGGNLFLPASYEQEDISLGYQRRIKKKWTLGAEYRHRRRRYEPVFSARDQDGDYLLIFTDYQPGKTVDGATNLTIAVIESGQGLDQGIVIDRSYDMMQIGQEFIFRLSKKLRLQAHGDFRRKDYTTGVQEDGGRYNRQDDRIRLGLNLRRYFGSNMVLGFYATWIDSNSDRTDPTVQTDQVGYKEVVAGARFTYLF
jgi:hypothetical protein